MQLNGKALFSVCLSSRRPLHRGGNFWELEWKKTSSVDLGKQSNIRQRLFIAWGALNLFR